MNQPWIYMYSPSWSPLPPPSLPDPSGSSQCTRPPKNTGTQEVIFKLKVMRWQNIRKDTIWACQWLRTNTNSKLESCCQHIEWEAVYRTQQNFCPCLFQSINVIAFLQNVDFAVSHVAYYNKLSLSMKNFWYVHAWLLVTGGVITAAQLSTQSSITWWVWWDLTVFIL